MTRGVAIIGPKNSGKTTFLTLLYAAQIRYSEFSDGGFRFYINPKSLEPISSEYNRMQMGNWPSDELIKNTAEISFLFGRVEKKGKGGLFGFLRKEKEPEITALNFSIFDISEQDYRDLVKDNKMSYINMKPKVDKLMENNILIVTIDASAFKEQVNKSQGGKTGDAGGGENADIDGMLANLLDNIARKHKRMIYALIVFTKFDEVGPKLLGRLHLPTKPPDKMQLEERQKHAETLLGRFYPKMLNQVRNNKYINNDGGHYFYSNLRTERKKGRRIPSLIQTVDSGFVIDCDYKEFINFIEHLEKISKY